MEVGDCPVDLYLPPRNFTLLVGPKVPDDRVAVLRTALAKEPFDDVFYLTLKLAEIQLIDLAGIKGLDEVFPKRFALKQELNVVFADVLKTGVFVLNGLIEIGEITRKPFCSLPEVVGVELFHREVGLFRENFHQKFKNELQIFLVSFERRE